MKRDDPRRRTFSASSSGVASRRKELLADRLRPPRPPPSATGSNLERTSLSPSAFARHGQDDARPNSQHTPQPGAKEREQTRWRRTSTEQFDGQKARPSRRSLLMRSCSTTSSNISPGHRRTSPEDREQVEVGRSGSTRDTSRASGGRPAAASARAGTRHRVATTQCLTLAAITGSSSRLTISSSELPKGVTGGDRDMPGIVDHNSARWVSSFDRTHRTFAGSQLSYPTPSPPRMRRIMRRHLLSQHPIPDPTISLPRQVVPVRSCCH